ncbi:MAG: hypothetical protein EBS05_06850 [Proteobacteria bacterium]|jgi:hypothetical protein|nr:hypothetical protein [Pseudomonadota bacterium]
MKQLLLLTALCAALTAQAQEKVPSEEVQKIARRVLDQFGETSDAQVKIAPDAEHADALKAGDAGIMVIPDKKLTAELLEKVGADLVPVGQLYFKSVAPAKDGKVTANDKLRVLTFEDKGNSIRIPLCLLGARKRDGQLELVVFGNEKTPLAQLTLRKAESSSGNPIELSGEKQGDDTGVLTLSIVGKYKAALTVMKQAD